MFACARIERHEFYPDYCQPTFKTPSICHPVPLLRQLPSHLEAKLSCKGFVDACVSTRSQWCEFVPSTLTKVPMLSISRASKRPLQTAALPVAQRWWYPYDPSVRVPDEEESSAAAGKGTDTSGKRPARMPRTGDPGLGSRFSFWCVAFLFFFLFGV